MAEIHTHGVGEIETSAWLRSSLVPRQTVYGLTAAWAVIYTTTTSLCAPFRSVSQNGVCPAPSMSLDHRQRCYPRYKQPDSLYCNDPHGEIYCCGIALSKPQRLSKSSRALPQSTKGPSVSAGLCVGARPGGGPRSHHRSWKKTKRRMFWGVCVCVGLSRFRRVRWKTPPSRVHVCALHVLN